MRTILFAALALLGCAKETGPTPAPEPKPATRPDAAPARDPIVTLVSASAAGTHPVVAAGLVVVKADGTILLTPRPGPGEGVDLTALAPGAVVPLDQLEDQARTMLDAVHEGFRKDGGPADCIGGAVGMGRYGTVTDGGRMHAGLIGYGDEGHCHELNPLVLADARAPATKVVEVLSALTHADLAIAVDGGAEVRRLPITFDHLVGNSPPLPDALELGFTLRANGVTASAYQGETADAKSWTWTGDVAGIPAAYAQGRALEALREADLRLRVDADTPASVLVTAIADLLAGGARRIAIGEPIDKTSYGISGGRRHVPSGVVPSMRMDPPKITGGYDLATARRYLKRHSPKLKYCYEKQLLVKTDLDGSVTATFTISELGLVTAVTAKGLDPDVDACVAAVVKQIEFPKPKDGKPSDVEAVFTFHPSGG